MTRINMHAAKSSLSRLIAGLESEGGEVLLCRAGQPVARLTAAVKPGRKIGGQLRGQIWLAEDFDAPSGKLFDLP